ncbi:MAG: permease, partial [Candidatus Zixiibacteriota bacterium]
PEELLSRWVGKESGLRGILIGTLAGGLTPGGPFVSLPVAAGFLRAGASIGTMVAFLTGWSLWAVSRLPMEVGIMGWKFTVVRLATTFFFPPIAGLIANRLFPDFM